MNSINLDDLKLFPKNSKWTKKFSSYWIPGEKNALIVFKKFKKEIIENYDEGRDRPDKDYTSKLSPYLHFGEISPQRIFDQVNKMKIMNAKSKKKFLAEIAMMTNKKLI